MTADGRVYRVSRNGIWAKGDITDLSQTCRIRHGEGGTVEFGLEHADGDEVSVNGQCAGGTRIRQLRSAHNISGVVLIISMRDQPNGR